jgi:hypothetical protein
MGMFPQMQNTNSAQLKGNLNLTVNVTVLKITFGKVPVPVLKITFSPARNKAS